LTPAPDSHSIEKDTLFTWKCSMPTVKLAATVTNTLKDAHEIVLQLRSCDEPDALKRGIEQAAYMLAEARADALAVQELVSSLRARLKAANTTLLNAIAFDQATDNYIRRPTMGGGFVYVERENMENSPLFCAHCFGKRTLSILQPTVIEHMLRCPGCGTTTKD
jgi:hypothetical protein